MRRGASFCLAMLLAGLLPAGEARCQAVVEASGIVQVQKPGAKSWTQIENLPLRLASGASVRTGGGASALVSLADDSRVSLGQDTSLTLEEASESRHSLKLHLGILKAYVTRIARRRFEVRTPTAVASVRGTEFQVTVLSGGRTRVELYRGLLGVEDNRGNHVLLRPNESLSVDRRGMAVPQHLPSQREARRGETRSSAARELGLDMSKEEVLAAAVREIKLAEYQQGKALIDLSGRRVRVEEYVMRPRADQFKFVVLNKREGRLDYFYYLGTFNQALPTDMSAALRQLGGRADSAPDYFLTAFEAGRSNTRDSLLEKAEGGHLVDVNHNVGGGDDVSQLFDPVTDRFEDVSGRPVFTALYDRYAFYLNGRLKYGWTGADLQTYSDKVLAADTDPITGAALTAANAYLGGDGLLPLRTVSATYPDADRLHQRIYESYGDGSYISWDNYIISDEGKVADGRDFAGAVSGGAFRARLLDFNFEQVITATEFGGRDIDLVVAPKMLIQAGLLR
ncbi:MAG: FecR family protein [Elusimicrobiota bacterium]